MLQVVNRGIDLIQRVSMRDEVVQLELAFAVPANEHRKTRFGLPFPLLHLRQCVISKMLGPIGVCQV